MPEPDRSLALHPGPWASSRARPRFSACTTFSLVEDISRPEFWFERIHAEDRPRVQAHFDHCMQARTDYRAGYRIVLPNGSIRYQYATGHPVTNAAGDLVEFIGASMDMTEHWLATTELERASQALRELQAKMSRASQVAAVGELAGSIAHQVNQPLAAVVANGHACLRWLAASPPNIAKAVEAADRIVKDGKDAGEVVRRVRSLFKRGALRRSVLDANQVIREVLRLLDSNPTRKQVSLEVTLAPNLPPIIADQIQLQQLVLNLMLNAFEALEPVSDREKATVGQLASPSRPPPARDLGQWHRHRRSGSSIRTVRHHQARGNGAGVCNLPLDCDGSRRQAVGQAQP